MFVFYKISIIKQDTNFISQTFGQTNLLPPIGMPKNLYSGILSSSFWSKTTFFVYFWKTNVASKYPALKMVASAHMFELKKLKTYSWKLKMVYWKLKTVYWKLKMYSWKLKMVVLFSYGKVKNNDFFCNKDQISSGVGKRKG